MSLFKRKPITSEEVKPVSGIDWKPLTDIGQLVTIVEESNENSILIFKHSTRCGISRMVLKQFEKEFQFQDEMKLYFLDLLNHRDISNAIASRFDVQHQSPQVVVIKEGKLVYNASHESIAAADLNRFV